MKNNENIRTILTTNGRRQMLGHLPDTPMNRDEFKKIFDDKAVPFLTRFHQRTTDALSNRVVFWLSMTLAMIGLTTLIRWVL